MFVCNKSQENSTKNNDAVMSNVRDGNFPKKTNVLLARTKFARVLVKKLILLANDNLELVQSGINLYPTEAPNNVRCHNEKCTSLFSARNAALTKLLPDTTQK